MFALTQNITRTARHLLLAVFGAGMLVAVPVHADHHGDMAKKDIVDTAVAAGSFTTLVAAVQAAGLVDTLKGEGPFTVFAPTDEAFAKIPAADLDALLADKDKLTAVLTYHVVPGKIMAADVVALTSADTVQGSALTIDASNGVMVDSATVVKTDIEASNGVIHVIDSVLMPGM
ncbi:MAG TPA: fasciclin domain-containing protein [Kineobactrum sp.]